MNLDHGEPPFVCWADHRKQIDGETASSSPSTILHIEVTSPMIDAAAVGARMATCLIGATRKTPYMAIQQPPAPSMQSVGA